MGKREKENIIKKDISIDHVDVVTATNKME